MRIAFAHGFGDCPICNFYWPIWDVLLGLLAIVFFVWLILGICRWSWNIIRDFNKPMPEKEAP